MKNSSAIDAYLSSRIAAGDFPSAVYLFAEKGEVVLQDALGLAVVEPEQIEATIDTIYDLASLTKVLVTGLLCAKLVECGELALSDQISRFFAEFDTDDKREITIRSLLTHSSGFINWKPFYLCENAPKNSEAVYLGEGDAAVGEFIKAEIARTELQNPVGSTVVYSDLNFLLLGFLLEKLYGRDINSLLVSEIVTPLGLNRTFMGGLERMRREFAASEFGNDFEKQTCLNLNYDVAKIKWREYQIWGEVHDANCFYLRGVSGHAGLFSTAFETFLIAKQFLAEYSVLLKPDTCSLFRTDFTPGMNEARSFAFQLAATKDSTASAALAPDSFGHLGFTGTSLWIDPVSDRIFILLTNRTHHRKLPFELINSVRRKFHELAASGER